LRFVGRISYGIYIYHTIFFVLYWSTPLYRIADALPLRHVWHLVFQVALPIPAATVSWYALEQPLLRLKRFFVADRPGWFRVPAAPLPESGD
jgi:peptidoglycan/LPS O-acetylase OafA/YrhL